MQPLKPLSILAAVACLAGGASAQNFDIVVNEVLYDPTGPDAGLQLIELKNRDPQEANLLGWALSVSYPGSIQDNRTYWPFPVGFKIPPLGTVTIHYLADGIDTSTDFYTGSNGAAFICVTPPKPMDLNVGGIGIYNTTNCSLFSNFQNIVDFVQWGGSAYHEVQAHAAGIWSVGTWVADVPEGHSIAYAGSGDTPQDWFDDKSPTFNLENTYPGSATTAGYGTGCAGTSGVPLLGSVGGPPAMGNQSFHLRLEGGLVGAPAVVAMSANPGSLPLFGCTVEIDLATLILQLGPQTVDATGAAEFWLPVPDDLNLLGVPLYFQGGVIDAGAPGGIVALSTALQAVL